MRLVRHFSQKSHFLLLGIQPTGRFCRQQLGRTRQSESARAGEQIVESRF